MGEDLALAVWQSQGGRLLSWNGVISSPTVERFLWPDGTISMVAHFRPTAYLKGRLVQTASLFPEAAVFTSADLTSVLGMWERCAHCDHCCEGQRPQGATYGP